MFVLAMLLGSASYAKRVHTLGDSTMAPYDESATVTRGWGMYFGQFLTNGWTSVNYAKGGRDAYGGYNELWQTAKKNVEAGDYVIITFGHNDEKNSGMDGHQLKAYYEGIGDATAAAAVDLRGSIPSTTYKENLAKIVDEAIVLGATQIDSGCCRSVTNAFIVGLQGVAVHATVLLVVVPKGDDDVVACLDILLGCLPQFIVAATGVASPLGIVDTGPAVGEEVSKVHTPAASNGG